MPNYTMLAASSFEFKTTRKLVRGIMMCSKRITLCLPPFLGDRL